MNNICTHREPAWGRKANCIIMADLTNYGMRGRFEQFWARYIDTTIFEICCIPFFTYGIALGDRVETNAEYIIQEVIEKRGHRNLRVAAAVKKKKIDEVHIILHEWVESTGLAYEFHCAGYLAVDLPPVVQGEVSFPTLEQLSEKGQIRFEIDE